MVDQTIIVLDRRTRTRVIRRLDYSLLPATLFRKQQG